MSKKVHIEFIKSAAGYEVGDRVWREPGAAKKLVDVGRVARYVTKEEIEARREDDEVDTGEPLSVQVMFVRDVGPYVIDDRVWRTEREAEQLVKLELAKKVQVRTDKADEATAEGDDLKAQLRAERAKQLEGLDYNKKIRPAATAVAKRIDTQPESHEGDVLKEYLLDHWADYKAVTA